jgi:hypothetical protein
MGLAERRAVKDFQDNHFPSLARKISDAAGFDVPIEVDWESLAIEGESHLYIDSWPKVFFQPLAEAFQSIARDDMGKEALKAGLKKITIKHNSNVYYGDEGYGYAAFKGGVLMLEHAAHTNVDNVQDRTKGIVTVVEKAL